MLDWRHPAALGLALIAVACATPPKPKQTVKALQIEGNREIGSRSIKKRILTTPTGWWPLAKPQPFDPVAWQADLERIGRMHEARGFHQVKVAGQVQDDQRKGEVVLWVKVQEGERTAIGSLNVVGLDAIQAEDKAAALDELPLVPGQPFNEDNWSKAKTQLHDRLRNRGYYDVVIRAIAKVDVAKHVADLEIKATPGPKYRFGAIAIIDEKGLVNPAWIRDEVKVAIPEGAYFSDEALREAETRTLNMGVFVTARVRPGPPDPDAARIPVIVEVNEGPWRTVKAGFGVGFDQIRDEVRVLSEWTHRNWLGGLRRLRLRAQAGWAFLPSAYSVVRAIEDDIPQSGLVGLAGVEFEQPRVFFQPTLSARVIVEGERRLEQAFSATTTRGNTALIWRPRSDFSLTPAYQIENSWVDVPGVVTAAVTPEILGCKGDPCRALLSFLEQTATWDRRDNPLAARKGFLTSLGVQEGGGPLGGDFSYMRFIAEARGYITPDLLDGEWTFAARAQVGGLYPRGGRPEDSPISQRFYGGGAVSMRGFNGRRLSPLLGVPVDGSQDPNAAIVTLPIGGNGLSLTSVEVRWHLTTNLQLALFLDAGQVTRDTPVPADVLAWQYAVGIGARYQTPIGPIRVDIARRLPFGENPTLTLPGGATRSYARDTSCFGIGGSSDPQIRTDGSCAFHFSIGEAF